MDNAWTAEHVEKLRQKVVRTALAPLRATNGQPAKRGKHGSRKTLLDGITFDSAKEAARYQDLKLLERVGAIRDLELQPEYDCYGANGERICGYRGDFRYYSIEHGKVIREDVKSRHTRTLPDYRIKFKLMRAQGTPITEIV